LAPARNRTHEPRHRSGARGKRRTETGADGIGGEVGECGDALRQVRLQAFQGKAQGKSCEQAERTGEPRPQHRQQGGGDERRERDVREHVDHHIEHADVARPRSSQEMPGSVARIAPAGERRQAGVHDQQCVP